MGLKSVSFRAPDALTTQLDQQANLYGVTRSQLLALQADFAITSTNLTLEAADVPQAPTVLSYRLDEGLVEQVDERANELDATRSAVLLWIALVSVDREAIAAAVDGGAAARES